MGPFNSSKKQGFFAALGIQLRESPDKEALKAVDIRDLDGFKSILSSFPDKVDIKPKTVRLIAQRLWRLEPWIRGEVSRILLSSGYFLQRIKVEPEPFLTWALDEVTDPDSPENLELLPEVLESVPTVHLPSKTKLCECLVQCAFYEQLGQVKYMLRLESDLINAAVSWAATRHGKRFLVTALSAALLCKPFPRHIVQFLVQNGAQALPGDLIGRENYISPFAAAACVGGVESVKMLLPQIEDQDKALREAVALAAADVVEHLCLSGLSVDLQRLLLWTLESSNENEHKTVHDFIHRENQVKGIENHLDVAGSIQEGRRSICNFLIQQGATFDTHTARLAIQQRMGMVVLSSQSMLGSKSPAATPCTLGKEWLLEEAACSGDTELFEGLFATGAISATTIVLTKPWIHLIVSGEATSLQKVEMIRSSAQRGFTDMNQEDSQGNTPLHLATQADSQEVLIEILEQNVFDSMENPGKPGDVFQALLRHQRLISAKNIDGDTALHQTREAFNHYCYDLLLLAFADPYSVNNKGETPRLPLGAKIAAMATKIPQIGSGDAHLDDESALYHLRSLLGRLAKQLERNAKCSCYTCRLAKSLNMEHGSRWKAALRDRNISGSSTTAELLATLADLGFSVAEFTGGNSGFDPSAGRELGWAQSYAGHHHGWGGGGHHFSGGGFDSGGGGFDGGGGSSN